MYLFYLRCDGHADEDSIWTDEGKFRKGGVQIYKNWIAAVCSANCSNQMS